MARQKMYKGVVYRECKLKEDHKRHLPGEIVTGTRARMIELKDYVRCVDIDYAEKTNVEKDPETSDVAEVDEPEFDAEVEDSEVEDSEPESE